MSRQFQNLLKQKFYNRALHDCSGEGRNIEEKFLVGPFAVSVIYDGWAYKPPFVGGVSAMLIKGEAIVAHTTLLNGPKNLPKVNDPLELDRFLEMVG